MAQTVRPQAKNRRIKVLLAGYLDSLSSFMPDSIQNDLHACTSKEIVSSGH
jgi:hypothetical protein